MNQEKITYTSHETSIALSVSSGQLPAVTNVYSNNFYIIFFVLITLLYDEKNHFFLIIRYFIFITSY